MLFLHYMFDFPYTIPSNITRIKIDVGLSYSAPQSQVWLDHNNDVFVFGFEPNPDSVRSLQSSNIQKQHPGHGQPLSNQNKSRFHLFPIALSNVNKKQEMDFYMTANDCGTSSLYKPKELLGPIKAKVSVPVYSLAHFFDSFPWDRFPYIEYLKIDAQGADFSIVKSAKQYLSERIVFVTLEPHGSLYEGGDDCTEENIEAYMKQNNFIRIQHPMTVDPTFVNSKFLDVANSIFIYQKG